MAQNQNNNFGVLPIVGLGYGYGGGDYYARQISNNMRNNEFARRQERIYDKYQIDTENFTQYRKQHGGSWAGRAIGIGLAVGALVAGTILAFAAAPVFFGIFTGLMAGIFGAAVTVGIKQSKDTNGYTRYLDQNEREGRHKAHLKQAEVQPEKAVSADIQQEKAMAAAKGAMPDAEMASYSVSSIKKGVVQDPAKLNERLQPPERELVAAGKAPKEKG